MSFHDRGAVWYLAQIKPNAIRLAERNLLRQGFRVFCPREDTTTRVRGRFKTVERPYFPGHVFVGLNPAKGGWRAINSTMGISRLVSFGAAPAEVPPALMTELQGRCDGTGRIQPAVDLAPGDRVRLTTGPFAEILAEVDRITPDRRVWVLMELLNGRTRVAVEAGQVQKVV
jgi:transcriptional antiterminator RfaH